MKPADMWATVRPRPVRWSRSDRVEARAHSLEDLRRMARRSLPAPVMDYLEGGADEEVALRSNTEAYRSWRIQPRSLVDVSTVDLRADLLGRTMPMPMLLNRISTGYSGRSLPSLRKKRGASRIAAAAAPASRTVATITAWRAARAGRAKTLPTFERGLSASWGRRSGTRARRSPSRRDRCGWRCTQTRRARRATPSSTRKR